MQEYPTLTYISWRRSDTGIFDIGLHFATAQSDAGIFDIDLHMVTAQSCWTIRHWLTFGDGVVIQEYPTLTYISRRCRVIQEYPTLTYICWRRSHADISDIDLHFAIVYNYIWLSVIDLHFAIVHSYIWLSVIDLHFAAPQRDAGISVLDVLSSLCTFK